MSYILDALRKSDQLRQQGAAPTLMSVPFPVPETHRRTPLLLGVLAAMLFVVGILVGWWQPWQPEQTRPTVPARNAADGAVQASGAGEAQPAQLPAGTLQHDTGNMAEPLQGANRQPKHLAAPQAVPVASSARTVPLHASDAPIAAGTANNSHVAVAKPETVALAETVPSSPAKQIGTEPNPVVAEQKALTRAELPAAIQQEIPPMVVSLHAYSSKPKSRLVSVNNQMLREGDSLLPGLIVEQITPDGMIFGYKGFHFRQGVH